MTRRSRLVAHLRRALGTADVIALAGIGCLVLGAGLAWPPAGLLVLGTSLLLIARYGTEAT